MAKIKTPKENRYIDSVYNFRDKVECANNYIDSYLNRTLSMFTYRGLPDTIPERELESILQIQGCGVIGYDESGDLRAFIGQPSSPLDTYYRPSTVIVSNPYSGIGGFNHIFRVYPTALDKQTDGVFIRNDSLNIGMLPLIRKYAAFKAEADLSVFIALINSRKTQSAVAENDAEAKSVAMFEDAIEQGKLVAMTNAGFSDGIKLQSGATAANPFTQLIEIEQYIDAKFYNEIGLNMNVNMKRERLTSDEVTVNSESLKSLIDDMLENRNKQFKEVNKMFGTDISVEYNGAWAQYNYTGGVVNATGGGQNQYVRNTEKTVQSRVGENKEDNTEQDRNGEEE